MLLSTDHRNIFLNIKENLGPTWREFINIISNSIIMDNFCADIKNLRDIKNPSVF